MPQTQVEQVGAVAVRVLFEKPDARRRVTTRGIGRKLNLFDDAAHRTLIRSLRRLQAPAGACGRVSVSAPSAVAVDKWPAASVAPGAQQV